MKRYDCLVEISRIIDNDTIVVCNLQDTTYEWNAIRPSDLNLLRFGMGMVTPCGLGLALARPEQRVIALDGDGSLLLELGAITTLARYMPNNYQVVVFDNESYNAGGDFPSATADGLDLAAVAAAAGVQRADLVDELPEFIDCFESCYKSKRSSFTVAKIQRAPELVPRPAMDGIENKYRFVRAMEALHDTAVFEPDDGPSFF